jgi:hypothetical protein
MYVCAGPIGDEPWLRESLLLQEKNNDLHLKYSKAKPQFLSVILSAILGHSSSSTIPVGSLQKQRQLITDCQLNNSHGISSVANERRRQQSMIALPPEEVQANTS